MATVEVPTEGAGGLRPRGAAAVPAAPAPAAPSAWPSVIANLGPVFVPVPRSRPRSGDGDLAAGPSRQLSLTASGLLPALCCWAPGVALFSLLAAVLTSAAFAPHIFYVMTAVLTVFTLTYTANLTVSCVFGVYHMRRDTQRDWQAMLQKVQEQQPKDAEVMHIVILPNYKEEEQMLRYTLENIGRSPLARESIRVVLAMEEREGPAGRQKAERLIAATSHLFCSIVASYHPAGLPGEVAGKSSNTQWAYRETLRLWAADLGRLDASRVFLTVGDADTLWHPQFFSAIAYEALTMPAHERAWSIWQPPVMLLRNLFSVPAPTRVSCYGTILFELAGLANQWFAPAFCFSAYSMTLALASHPLVGGWDRDVIAEDHHMFCKCFFAALWEAADAPSRGALDTPVVPKVRVRPVFLPAISYLVESDGGWFDSCWARFQQARRHSQGVAELSYMLLQYANLLLTTGVRLPLITHTRILGIIGKMATVHIINAVQAFTLLLTPVLLLPGLLSWASHSGAQVLSEAATVSDWLGLFASQVVSRVGWHSVLAIFGPLPPVGMLMTAITYIVVHDAVTGRLTQAPTDAAKEEKLAAPDVQGSVLCVAGNQQPTLGWRRKLGLLAMVQADILSMAEVTLMAYGLIPVSMAAWSLMRHGTKFEYIVAAKPT